MEDRVETGLEPNEEMETGHAAARYDTLVQKVVPCFYRDRNRFTEIMRYMIAVSSSFFNAHLESRVIYE